MVTPKAEYKAPRTPWGHPDFQGIWTSDSVMGVPVEKAIESPSPEDLARQKKIRDVEAKLDASGSNVVFEERELKWTIKKPASLVTDPPDGRIPLTAEMQKLLDDSSLKRYGIGVESWTDLDLWDRCISKGYPTVMLPMGYSNLYEIIQTPNHVALFYEVIHDARIIPLDGRRARRFEGPSVLGRFPRPLGGRHARRRSDQLQRQDVWHPATGRQLSWRRQGHEDRRAVPPN